MKFHEWTLKWFGIRQTFKCLGLELIVFPFVKHLHKRLYTFTGAKYTKSGCYDH